MKLIVNGQNLDITIENEKTVGDVLKAFEAEAAKNKATTIGIKLNGKEIPADDFENAIKESIKEDTIIELSVISQSDIKASFEESKKSFTELSENLKEIPVLLQSCKDKEANQKISELANEIEKFCRTSTLAALFPEIYSKLKIDGKELTDFFEEFAPILKDFEDALENKDSVTIGDLAEYEIAPRLEKMSAAVSALD